MNKKIVLLIAVLLIGISLYPNTAGVEVVKTNSNTLYVGGSGDANYTRIQDAINDSSDGYTVFVYNGTYEESLHVNKSINLIGEDKLITILNNNTISIETSNVSISGFTMQDGLGINIVSRLLSLNNNTISGNIFTNEYLTGIPSVTIIDSSYNTVSNNSFFNCGLWLAAYHNFVYNNTVNGKPLVFFEDASDKVIDDAGQVILISCNNITVENLTLFNSTIGVELIDCINCFISDNIFSNNFLGGIYSINSNNNTISGNTIWNNVVGLFLGISRDNTISKNSFENSLISIYLIDSYYNLFSQNNFKYLLRLSNIVSLDSDNKWTGNYWNKPRVLPVLIWGIKTTRFKIIRFGPSLDFDWHPAKEPFDIPPLELS